MPPYAAAAVVTVGVGFIADRTKQRGITNILTSLVAIAGFALLLGAPSPGARYAGTFLGAIGIYPTISNTISWCTNNTEGTSPPCHLQLFGFRAKEQVCINVV